MTTRIAYVNQTGALGGAEIALSRVVAALDRERWAPLAFLGGDGPLVPRLRSAAVQVEVLPLPPVLSEIRQSEIGLGAMLAPRRLKSAGAYVGQLATRLRDQQIRLAHANSLRACVVAGFASRVARIPCIWHIHSVVAPPAVSPTGTRMLQILARRLADHIICNSAFSARPFGRLPASRLSVIPCGVPAPPAIAQDNPHASPRIGMIARFAPIKGQHILVEAIRELGARHPGAKFVFAGKALFGEEDYARLVRDKVERSPFRDRVTFLDFVEDIPSLLDGLDIVVHASLQPEGFGQSVAEAMIAGKVVVASSAGGTTEIIDDGVTGVLVPPGDTRAVAEAIDDLLSNPAKAQKMGKLAQEVACERYDIRKTSRAIEDVYEKVLANA